MLRPSRFNPRAILLPAVLGGSLLAISPARAQQWITPTAEELSMKDLAEAPGARAVVLNRDELNDDDNHMLSRYFRIKVLTEAGKDEANVKLFAYNEQDGRGWKVDEVAGRTVQPDGSVVPFTGKPFEKVIEKNGHEKVIEKSFSLPSVQVGSIVEFRYKLRWEDNLFRSPDWDIQTDLYLRKGHFLWKPTQRELVSTSRGGHESMVNSLAWDAVLPNDQILKPVNLPNGKRFLEVNVANVAPFATDEFMPPAESTAFHVHFYYTPYRSGQEFWKTEGKYWSSEVNHFADVNDTVRRAANDATAGAKNDEEKARALYRLVSTFENTDYTRTRDKAEEKSAGLKETKSAADIISRKRGSSNQIAIAYVALARAAGLNASMMLTSDRGQRLMRASYLNFGQLTDVLAIVNYGGKDHFLDPGSPMVPFGHLDWNHTDAAGVKQTGKETELALSPGESYRWSHTGRVADLKLKNDGSMAGIVSMTFEGGPAITWRQRALRTDDEGLKEELRNYLEERMPGQTGVEVSSITGLLQADLPLKVIFKVDGHLGSATGSRVVLPADIFVMNDKPRFPHEKRDQPVYYHYAEFMQDAVRVAVPPEFSIESVPPDTKLAMKQAGAYGIKVELAGSTFTARRDLVIGDFYFPVETFSDLRTFYVQFQQKDRASVVLKRTASEKAALQ